MRDRYVQGQPTVFGARYVGAVINHIRYRRYLVREQARRDSCRTCWGRRMVMSWRTAEMHPCLDCSNAGVQAVGGGKQ